MSLRVDVATGATSLVEEDLRLPGYFPLVMARHYRSSDVRQGPFGVGWIFSLDATLQVAPDLVTYRNGAERALYFRPIDVGMQATHAETGHVLEHHPDAYIVYRSPLIQQVFLKRHASGGVFRLDRIEGGKRHAVQLLYKGTHLIGVVDTLGRQVQCTWAEDRMTSMQVVAPDGKETVPVRTFRYENGNLIAVADEAGRETRYAYDDHLLVGYTNRLGGTQHAQYDADRRCLGLWQGDGSLVRRFAYDALRQITRVVQSEGAQTTYHHIEGQVLSSVDAGAAARHYYYDAAQRLISTASEEGTVDTLQMQDGETFLHIDGESRVAFFTLNAQGLAETVEDASGHAYSLSYNEHGQPVRLTTPLEHAWTFERDRRGRVAQIISPEERRVHISYSDDGRTRTMKDDLGLCAEERRDLFGRLIERVDGLGRREQRDYDAAGRLTAIKLGQSYEMRLSYNAAGNLTGVTDSRHRDHKFQYDAFGRLQARTGPDGQRWHFQYDREGRLAKAANGHGQQARFAYDDRSRLIHLDTQDGQAETYRYEAPGRVTAQRTGQVVVRTFSPLLDLLEEAQAGETLRRFVYGPSGELLEATLAGRAHRFAYNEEGRLVLVQGDEQQLVLDYDRDGCLSALQGMGEPVHLRRDRRGRIEDIHGEGGRLGRLVYDAGNRLSAIELPDDRRCTVSYDPLDRLQERTLEEAGRPAAPHRFRTKDTSGPVVDDLVQRGSVGLRLHQLRHGLVLAVRIDGSEVPVLYQPHYFAGGRADSNRWIIEARMQGVEALLPAELPAGAEWLSLIAAEDEGRVWMTDIPTSADVGMPWPVLDLFFLRRSGFDLWCPYPGSGAPGLHLLDHNPAADGAVTGSYRAGFLRSPGWTSAGLRGAQAVYPAQIHHSDMLLAELLERV